METEQSFGIIPLRRDDHLWMVFLILHRAGKHWGFPKGHKNNREEDKDAAVRELKEETALTVVRFLSEDPLIEQYQFWRKGTSVTKQVFYFPALVEGVIQLQKEEVRDGKWVRLDQASEVLSFKEAKLLCEKVVSLCGGIP